MTIHAYLDELDKVADAQRKQEDKREGYGKTILRLAPLTAVQAAYDLPEGMVEDKLEKTFKGVPKVAPPPGTPGPLKQALKRGMGRAGGRVAGLASAPLFYSGVKDIKSDDKERKKKGYGKVLASGALYSGGKSLIESAAELTKGTGNAGKKLTGALGVGTAIGLAQSAVTARALAKGQKKREEAREKGQKPNRLKALAAPVATGAAIGGLKGGLTRAAEQGIKNTFKDPKLRRAALAGAGAKAITGAAGGALAGELTDWALGKRKKSKVKTAAELVEGSSAGHINSSVRQWAADAHDAQLRKLYEQTLAHGAESTPSSRAVYYAVHDEMQARRWRPTGGKRGPDPQKRDRSLPPERSKPLMSAGALAGVAALPAIVWAGIDAMPQEEGSKVLQDALDRVAAENGIERIEMGQNFWGQPDSSAPATDLFLQLGDDAEEAIRASGDRDLLKKYRKGARKFISSSKGGSPEVFAHELGHALVGLRNPVPGDLLTATRAAGVILPIVALASVGDGSFATEEDIDAKARFAKNVGLIAGTLQAPAIFDEAAASLKAIKLMREAGVSGDELVRRSLRLLPGAATYLAPAAVPFLAARAIRQRSANRRSE